MTTPTPTTACRSCGAPVLFVPSATSGKPMILDAKPEKRIVIEPTSHAGQAHQPLTPSGTRVARVVDAYSSHFATCPAAGQWKGQTRTTFNPPTKAAPGPATDRTPPQPEHQH